MIYSNKFNLNDQTLYNLYTLRIRSDDEIILNYRLERSTDQVMKPVNLQALSKWVGFYPRHIVEDMQKIAPMLRRLGYDPMANPPRYDHADPRITDNRLHIFQYKKYWRNKGVDKKV